MHEYSFVNIPVVRRRGGTALKGDYRDVIHDRAADGWEFVQAIPFETDMHPHLDLVFTRKVEQ
ncbi:DUF4177 domain-containing protein [Microbacterium sp. AK031]|uniref:DUF4177 domain-containing protein n=1 Tax=Microbacterium sp. AK031 TaxID=2723076 RepID=UPI00216A2097|nr:DUF4177 domain-containing protein [Microbacterium sp. AK031]MCS3844001.1 hypothetical protein [Microbacterium sp. AK031]